MEHKEQAEFAELLQKYSAMVLRIAFSNVKNFLLLNHIQPNPATNVHCSEKWKPPLSILGFDPGAAGGISKEVGNPHSTAMGGPLHASLAQYNFKTESFLWKYFPDRNCLYTQVVLKIIYMSAIASDRTPLYKPALYLIINKSNSVG